MFTFIKNKRLNFLIFTLLMSFNSHAVELAALTSEQDLFADFSVTSATRLAQSPRDLPVSVTIITREMIDASGATEIPDLFRMVPGFRVGVARGGFYSVIGHGVGDQWARKLEVLIDGMPVQSPVINFVDWLSLPIEVDDIDYIEVMRGTSTAVYGTNAFDGAINIITKKPFEEKGFYYRVLSGEPDVKGHELKYGFQDMDSSHSVSAYYKENSGFDGQHDSSKNEKLRYRGNFNPTVSDEVDLMLGFNQGYKQEEGDGLVVKKRPRDVNSSQQYVRWQHRYDDGDAFTLKAYHHYVKYDDLYQTALLSEFLGVSPSLIPVLFDGRPDQPVEFGLYYGRSNRYGLDIQQSINFDNARFVIGAGFVYDKIVSDILFADDSESKGLTKQVFANLEWNIQDDLVLNSSMMVEKPENRTAKASPRVSLNYHFDDINTVRISAARSYRARTTYSSELYLASRFTSDGSIFDIISDHRSYNHPEKITSYELAHLVHYPNFDLDWKIYRDIYADTRESMTDKSIDDALNNGASVTINGKRYEVKGFELQIKYIPSNRGFIAFQYSLASSNGSILDKINPDSYKNYDDAVPRYSYGALISRKLTDKVNLGLTYTKVDKVNWRGSGDNLPKYERLDMNLSNRFSFKKTNVKIEFIAQNLLSTYKEFRDENLFDTRYLIRVSFEYL